MEPATDDEHFAARLPAAVRLAQRHICARGIKAARQTNETHPIRVRERHDTPQV